MMHSACLGVLCHQKQWGALNCSNGNPPLCMKKFNDKDSGEMWCLADILKNNLAVFPIHGSEMMQWIVSETQAPRWGIMFPKYFKSEISLVRILDQISRYLTNKVIHVIKGR